MNDYTKGLMYGLCVGDSLGSRYEFMEKKKLLEVIKQDTINGFLTILGGGVFNTEPGQFTDDSEMALSLLSSLASKKTYSQRETAKEYIKWYNTKPIDKGVTIERALSSFTLVSQNNKDMMINSERYNKTSLSNGTLMRIAPMSLLYKTHKLKKIRSFIKKDCLLTHPNPFVIECTWLYVYTIIKCLEKKDKEKIFKKLLKLSKNPKLYLLILDSKMRPEPVIIDSEEVFADDPKLQGYIGIAFQSTLYELFNGTDFDSSIINILKRGGDTDTNCAIAGAVLGAYYGFSSINKNWIETINSYKGERSKYYSTKLVDKYIDQIN